MEEDTERGGVILEATKEEQMLDECFAFILTNTSQCLEH